MQNVLKRREEVAKERQSTKLEKRKKGRDFEEEKEGEGGFEELQGVLFDWV